MLAFSAFSGGRVEVRARAKVNLGLEVLGRRADGYHELRSVMWAIDLADRVTLEPGGDGIALECAAPDVPRTPDNLAWRAAELVRRETGAATGLRIRIEKRIPVAAGLGGGSADAAAVRRRSVRCGRRRRRAASAGGHGGRRSGWTCPSSCGGARRWRGDAERRSGRCRRARDLSLVIANPGFPRDARRATRGSSRPTTVTGVRSTRWSTALRRGVDAVAAAVTNGLERAAARLWPGLGRGQGGAASGAGCLAALMSGSGPTVFGIAPVASGGAPDPRQRWRRGRGGSGSRARSPARS